jgi:5-methylcytosine-specific restriction protein B
MSRYCGDKRADAILDAARQWKDRALLGQGSVFTAQSLWTTGNLETLDRDFVQRPDEGEGSFLEKLRQQLAPSEPSAKQLAAEIMWLLYLCPSSITPRHKRATVQAVWEWSGEQLPADLALLQDVVLEGVGSAGPGFNQNQWRELAYCISVVRAFRRVPVEEGRRLLDDGWAFAEWLGKTPDSDNRQFRHMLLFLLHPDHFERIFGQRDRREVLVAYSGLERRALNKLNPVGIDRALYEVRKKLETEYGTNELDFYIPPLKGTWKTQDFSEAVETISSAHVEQAIAEIDRDGVPPNAQSMYYDLVHKGRRYPAKLVLSLAAKYATGEELARNMFSGGETSPAFRLLRKLGFEIKPKDSIPTLITKFLAQAKAGRELSVQGYLQHYRDLDVKVSFGKGVQARIAWVAFLAPGQFVSKGIYPVLLLFRNEGVLLLCYEVSEEGDADQAWSGVGSALTVKEWFNKRFARNPDRYGASFVKTAYEVDRELPMSSLTAELDSLISEYKQVLGMGASESPLTESSSTTTAAVLEIRANLPEAVESFSSALRQSFVAFGLTHEDLVRSFIAALVAKPFVILTGMSGSGKTQIAIRLGQWLGFGRLWVAPVRPDWTGAEALFGYEDGLKPAVEGRPAWVVPPVLEFMLKAHSDPLHPHLLLLDEMNLAHVERYFADVLSGMESGEPCLPNLTRAKDGQWRQAADGQPRLAFPRNLWIIGTVNVDETTYMFSPKVLDRANTFEFRVVENDLQLGARKPTRCSAGDEALVRGLLSICKNEAWQEANPATFGPELGEKLKQLHALLSRYGLEFGHRLFYEAMRFGALAEASGMGSFEAALDRIVIQKILPRLHGSRRRLEPPLLALAQFTRDLPDEISSDEKLPGLKVEQIGDERPQLPISFDKVSRMLRTLRTNQFASFTD